MNNLMIRMISRIKNLIYIKNTISLQYEVFTLMNTLSD